MVGVVTAFGDKLGKKCLQKITEVTGDLFTAGKCIHPYHPNLRVAGSASRKPGWTKAGSSGVGS